MKGNILLNFLFLVTLLFLLTIPILINTGFLQKPKEGDKVAGAKAETNYLSIQPNLLDFGGLVNFYDHKAQNELQQKEALLTFFPNQTVTYRRLYSLTNHSNFDLKLFVILKTDRLPDSSTKIEGLIENGQQYPLFLPNQQYVLTLKRNTTVYLTIKIGGGAAGNTKNQISLKAIFSSQPLQN